VANTPGAITELADNLHEYIDNFSDMFTCHRINNISKAHQYICGLVQSDRRNMERMEEAVDGADYEALQQFISNSPWDSRAVMNRVATESDKLLGGTGRTGLLIDETAFAKKGKASVGVSRQWNGRLGKVENSQVAVYGALCAGNHVIPIDTELFLPEIWTNDTARCKRSGVPEERFSHRTKPELALDIVRRQRTLGGRFDYVCADGL
jgi:SRSO17 transposase